MWEVVVVRAGIGVVGEEGLLLISGALGYHLVWWIEK